VPQMALQGANLESNEPGKPTIEDIIKNPSKLPSPPVEEEKPGGFEPFVPSAQPHPVYTIPESVANLQQHQIK
ncbi:hypothetical protein EVAR_72422_1, partial [Eumeta japonica]